MIMIGVCSVNAEETRSSMASYASGSSVMDTIVALDKNNNGMVDRSEIETFATSQGLGAADVMGDFQEIDTNSDGELDADEIAHVLTDSAAQQGSAAAAVAAKPAAAQLSNAGEAATVASVAAEPSVAAHATQTQILALASSAPSGQVEGETSYDVPSMQDNAEQQAGKILATNFASRAQQLLKQSVADEKSASSYEKEARSLRGKQLKMVQNAKDLAKRAAVDMSKKVGLAAEPEIKKLQLDAQKLEHEAAQQRTLAKQAMQRVINAQSAMARLFPANPTS